METLLDLGNFQCGDKDLDEFFAYDSMAYHQQLLGKTYLYKLRSFPKSTVAAFTISNASVRVDDLSNSRKKKIEHDIPYQKDFAELYTKCERTWIKGDNGVSGYLFKGPNGNTLFLSASGFCSRNYLEHNGANGNYWSSSFGSSNYNAYDLNFNSEGVFPGDYIYDSRYIGFSVRPVAEKQ